MFSLGPGRRLASHGEGLPSNAGGVVVQLVMEGGAIQSISSHIQMKSAFGSSIYEVPGI